MSEDYALLAKEILADLKEDGMPFTLQRTTSGGYDPVSGVHSSTQTKSYGGYGMLTLYSDALVDGKNIIAGDRRALVAFTDSTVFPKPGDTFVAGSESLTVVRVDAVNPAGKTLLFKVQVR